MQCNMQKKYFIEANRGAETQAATVNATGCGFDSRSRKTITFSFLLLLLSSVTQHTILPESDVKWGTETS